MHSIYGWSTSTHGGGGMAGTSRVSWDAGAGVSCISIMMNHGWRTMGLTVFLAETQPGLTFHGDSSLIMEYGCCWNTSSSVV
jgi:hypothetical protein